MSIGTTIKKLRRERDMTQEQLADLLGITANAISQWECDRTAPDISQLPMLSSIFRVSADEILGIDVSSRDAKIKEIYTEVRELWCKDRRDEAEKLCRDGLRRFPDAYNLMEELAINLSYSDEKEKLEESISLFERIRSGVNDECTRNYAVGNLCELYMQIGKPEKVKKLANSIPVLTYSKEECIRMTLKGKEWNEHVRHTVAEKFDTFTWELSLLLKNHSEKHSIFTPDEMLLLWQKLIIFYEVFYENGDYGFAESQIVLAHYRRSKLFLKLGETENALDELEKMASHIKHYDVFWDGLCGDDILLPPEKRYTSILVRPESDDDNRCTVSASEAENEAYNYLSKLRSKFFDPIRENSRFAAVVQELEKSAHR